MKTNIRLLLITFCSAKLAVLLPMLLIYILFLYLLLRGNVLGELDEYLTIFVYAEQALLPVIIVAWNLIYLHLWIDNDGEEALAAICAGRHSCAGEIVILTTAYILGMFPMYVLSLILCGTSYVYIILFEFLRIIIQVVIYSMASFLISKIFRSVMAGAVCVVAYHLFCILFCRVGDMGMYCLIRPDLYATMLP